MKPDEAFVRRMRALRLRRGWNVNELEDRVNSLSPPSSIGLLPRNTVAKIESPKSSRKPTLNEAIAIAAALGVPYTLMVVPVDKVEPGEVEDYEVEVAPGRSVQAWRLWEWAVGHAPLDVGDERRQALASVRFYERVVEEREAVQNADQRRREGPRKTERGPAEESFNEALAGLRRAVVAMEDAGYAAEHLVPVPFADEMRERGIK